MAVEESFVSMYVNATDNGPMALAEEMSIVFSRGDSVGFSQEHQSHTHLGLGLGLGAVCNGGLPPFPFPAPTMHPNLVSTLKNVISPPSLEQSTEGLDFLRAAGFDLLCSDALLSYQSGDGDGNGNGNDNGVAGIESPWEQQQEEEKEKEGERIAVVPVDLIQNRRPFKCAHGGCNKTFKNPQTLKMHHKTHFSDDAAARLGEQVQIFKTGSGGCRAGQNKKIPCRCPVCRRTFVGLYELRRHFGRKHSQGEKMHACNKCSKRFYIEVDLRDHQKLCGEPIECKCGMKFAFKCNLVAHKKTHPECQCQYDSSPSSFSTTTSTTTTISPPSKLAPDPNSSDDYCFSSTHPSSPSSCYRAMQMFHSHSHIPTSTSTSMASSSAPARPLMAVKLEGMTRKGSNHRNTVAGMSQSDGDLGG